MSSHAPLIAHILPWQAIGGTELATLRIAQAVRAHGWHNVMFCRADAHAVQQFFADQGFQTATFEIHPLETEGISAFVRNSIALARAFRRRRVDLVHCADVAAGDDAAVAARLAGARLVCHVRNRYPRINRFRRAWMLLANRLVFVSRHTQENFGHLARMPVDLPNRLGVVVYDGFTPSIAADSADAPHARSSVLAEFGLPADATVFGMVARLAVQKDHPTLVRAAELVVAARPNARFLLVGGCGPEEHELQHGQAVLAQIAASPAREHIVYAGFRSDIDRLLQAIDGFVLCTHFEGLPLVLLEAMAHGKPVVATAVDGIPEVVIDGQTGLLREHEDAEGLAARLLSLLDSPALAADWGAAGRQFVQERFSAARFAENVVRLYAGLLDRNEGKIIKPASAAVQQPIK